MSQKVVLIKPDGGQIWIDDAPDGDSLTLSLKTTFATSGETIADARWGEVRLFKATSHSEKLDASNA